MLTEIYAEKTAKQVTSKAQNGQHRTLIMGLSLVGRKQQHGGARSQSNMEPSCCPYFPGYGKSTPLRMLELHPQDPGGSQRPISSLLPRSLPALNSPQILLGAVSQQRHRPQQASVFGDRIWNEEITPTNHPLWFHFREFPGAFPHSLLSTSKVTRPSW